MNDAEKLNLIREIIADVWENTPQRKENVAGYYEGVLICINTVLYSAESESK